MSEFEGNGNGTKSDLNAESATTSHSTATSVRDVEINDIAKIVYEVVYKTSVLTNSIPAYPKPSMVMTDSEASMTLHNVLIFVASMPDVRLVHNGLVLYKFEVFQVFAGNAKEHAFNSFQFINYGNRFCADLSLEQYKQSEVTDPAYKPWTLFENVITDKKIVYPLKSANKLKGSKPAVVPPEDSHPLLPHASCVARADFAKPLLFTIDPTILENGFVHHDKETGTDYPIPGLQVRKMYDPYPLSQARVLKLIDN